MKTVADKKKLLIIYSGYLRSNTIGSVRPRKMAKYLAATGRYDITVLAASGKHGNAGSGSIKYSYDMSVLEQDGFIRKFILVARSDSLSKLKKLWDIAKSPKSAGGRNSDRQAAGKASQRAYPRNKPALFAEYTLNLIDDLIFYRRAKREIKKNKIWNADIIFSTYGPFSSHYIARYVKKKNPGIKWVADFRDPVYRDDVPRLYRAYTKRFIKKKCKTADALTAVSQGVLDSAALPDVPAHIITNGFDPDDVPKSSSDKSGRHRSGTMLVIAYTGSLYDYMRADALLKAIRGLIDEGLISAAEIGIEYAGSKEKEFSRQIGAYNLQDIFHTHGFVSRNEALEIQQKSDMLLVISRNTKEQTGVISGKFLEYMMMNKPVISLVAGDIPGSDIKKITDSCSLGFCCEEACGESGYLQLKNYIYKQYMHKAEFGRVSHNPDTNGISRYNYQNLAKKLEELFVNSQLTKKLTK